MVSPHGGGGPGGGSWGAGAVRREEKGDGQPGRSVEIGGVLELEMEMGL